MIDVHITGVELVVKGDGKTNKYALQAPVILRMLPQNAGELANELRQFVGHRNYGEPLPRGGAVIFALAKEAAPLSDLLANPEKLRIHISVNSNAGEICRVNKRNTLAYLAVVASQEPAQAS